MSVLDIETGSGTAIVRNVDSSRIGFVDGSRNVIDIEPSETRAGVQVGPDNQQVEISPTATGVRVLPPIDGLLQVISGGIGSALAGIVCIDEPFSYLDGSKVIGTLPAGYLVLASFVEIQTAWNAAGATVSLGSAADPDGLLNGTDPATLQVCPATADWFRSIRPVDLGGGSSVDVTVTVDSAGSTAGVGRAVVFAVAC